MEVDRKGNKIIIILDKEEEAVGLHAILSGQAHTIPEEMAQTGHWIYSWFFAQVKKLAEGYGPEKDIKTMSAETLTRPDFGTSAPRRQKKR